MARPRGARQNSKIDERESCNNVSGLVVEQIFAPDHHGYPRASRLTTGKTSMGPCWHPVSWLRRADRSSISSFHLVDLGGEAIDIDVLHLRLSFLMLQGSGEAVPSEHRRSLARCGERRWRRGVAGIPLVDLSELWSGIGEDPRLISVTAREDRPGDARKLIGERDFQHVAVKPLRCLLDPGPQTLPFRPGPPLEDHVGGLHEQCPHVFVSALGYLAQDRAIPGRLLLRYQPQPGGKIAPLLEAGAIADRRHDRAGDDRAHARNAHEPLATLVLLCQCFDLARYAGNPLVQASPVLDQLAYEVDHSRRQRVGF